MIKNTAPFFHPCLSMVLLGCHAAFPPCFPRTNMGTNWSRYYGSTLNFRKRALNQWEVRQRFLKMSTKAEKILNLLDGLAIDRKNIWHLFRSYGAYHVVYPSLSSKIPWCQHTAPCCQKVPTGCIGVKPCPLEEDQCLRLRSYGNAVLGGACQI